MSLPESPTPPFRQGGGGGGGGGGTAAASTEGSSIGLEDGGLQPNLRESTSTNSSLTGIRVGPRTPRDELLDQYHSLYKEKRDLRKRNIQAQTNIVQYFRRHKMDLFSSKEDVSPDILRAEYSSLLDKMLSLSESKEKDIENFGRELNEIASKKESLIHQVSRLEREIKTYKLEIAKKAIDPTSGRMLTHKVIKLISIHPD